MIPRRAQARMPYTIQVDHAKGRVVVVGTDPLSVSEVVVLFDRQVAAHAWSYGTRSIPSLSRTMNG
jgi:hypothetical protein